MNWVWNTALHTCITKGPGGRTCTQFKPGLVWSGLVWSQSSSPASDWSCEGLSNTQKWCARFALVPSPLSYQFLSSHSLLLFIALQLLCLVLKGAEQTWVSWVDMRKIYTWAWLWTSEQRLEARLSEHRFVLRLNWAELSWFELIWADAFAVHVQRPSSVCLLI
jgi:hypothetical protein